MKCNNCGAENRDGLRFCMSCGTELNGSSNTMENLNETGNSMPNMNINQPQIQSTPAIKAINFSKFDFKNMDKSKVGKIACIGGSAIIILIIAIVIISYCTSRVSLKNYVKDEISFSGLNGSGKIDTSGFIDYEGLNEAMVKIPKSIDEEYLYDYFGGRRDVSKYIEYKCTSDNDGKLSNGDEVIITVYIDKDGMKHNSQIKKTFFGGDEIEFKYTVEGLREPITIDPFDMVESVVLDIATRYGSANANVQLKENYEKDYGSDGIKVVTYKNGRYLNAKIQYAEDLYDSIDIFVDDSQRLDKNSKTVMIKASISGNNTDTYGIKLSATEKEFTPKIVSFAHTASLNKDNLKTLNDRMADYAKVLFGNEKYKLEKIIILYNNTENPDSDMCYFYKVGNDYAVTYYNDVKQDENGNITNIDELNANKEGWLGYNTYKSIDEYKSSCSFTDAIELPNS